MSPAVEYAHFSVGPQMFLGLTLHEWLGLLFGSFSIPLASAFWFPDESALAVAAMGFTLMVGGHLCLTADRYVAFPGLISFVAAIQWLAGPLLANFFPPSFSQYELAVPLVTYLKYALPVTVAFWMGIHLPNNKWLGQQGVTQPAKLPTAMDGRYLDLMIIGGIVLSQFADRLPASLGFVYYVLASFRFFGVGVYVLARKDGWKLRLVIVFLHLLAQASADGIFYQLIQWGGYFLLLYGFRQRWRWKVGVLLVAAVLGAVVLQYVKYDYRDWLSEQGEVPAMDRVSHLGTMAWNKISGSDLDDNTAFGDVLVRFNQGWIISRIMYRVPREVPYADGETIADAVKFTVLPRILFPEKPAVASKVLFFRYTGIQLGKWTSMGLSIAGEMYANFGYWGGIAGTFAFALLVGILFSVFVRLARSSLYWWAAVPVVLLAAIEPAWNIEDISNHIVKGSIVLFAVAAVVPWVSGLLEFGLRKKKVRFGTAIRSPHPPMSSGSAVGKYSGT